jgi:hypothetical protein
MKTIEEKRERWRKYSSERYEKSKDSILKKQHRYRKKRDDSCPAMKLLHGATRRAKERGVPCTITVHDIKVPDTCPILGIKLVNGRGKKEHGSYSLDRIVPELGYVVGNIIVMSDLANTMKNVANKEMLLRFCKNAPKIYGDCR